MTSYWRLLSLSILLIIFVFFISSQVEAQDQATGESLEIEGKHKHGGGQSYSNRRMLPRGGVPGIGNLPSCCDWKRTLECCPGGHI
ncbi:hypothetical protein ACS0TY_017357 [Phlomoides rotata]